MKNATNKEGLNSILSEIITDEENNVYFTHITGASCRLFLVEGEGLMTSKEIAERGYNDYDFDEEDIFDIWEVEDEYLRKYRGIDISDGELLELKDKFSRESTKSFFENGIYAEATDIKGTASELRGNTRDKITSLTRLVSDKRLCYNDRGSMVLILEIPKEYIYGEKKDKLFQTVESMEVESGSSHVATYTKCIPNHFIKSAIIVGRKLENEYIVIDNEEFRQADQQSVLQLFREKLERYDSLYTEEQFKLYDEAEKLGLDFKKELDDARAKIALRNDMREYFNGKRDITIEEINARCTELGLDFNNEMTIARGENATYTVSKEQIGKRTINKETPIKDASQNRTNTDITALEHTKQQVI